MKERIYMLLSHFSFMTCIAETMFQAMEFFYRESTRNKKFGTPPNHLTEDIINVVEDRETVDEFVHRYWLVMKGIETGIISWLSMPIPATANPVVDMGESLKLKRVDNETFKEVVENMKAVHAGRKTKRVSPSRLKERTGEILYKPEGKKAEAQREFLAKCTDRMMEFSQKELLDVAVRLDIDINSRATKQEICDAINNYYGYTEPSDVPEPMAPYLRPPKSQRRKSTRSHRSLSRKRK